MPTSLSRATEQEPWVCRDISGCYFSRVYFECMCILVCAYACILVLRSAKQGLLDKGICIFVQLLLYCCEFVA